MSMITATTWVPRGYAAPFPSKYEFDEDEYERIAQLAKLQLDDAKDDLDEAQKEKEQSRNGVSGSAGNSKNAECVDQEPIRKHYANSLLESLMTT